MRTAKKMKYPPANVAIILLFLFWIANPATAQNDNNVGSSSFISSLSNAELENYNNIKEVSICVTNEWMPFEDINENGEYVGLLADYMRLLSKTMDKPFNYNFVGHYINGLKAIEEGNCDLLPAAMPTNERSEYMYFTEPHHFLPLVVVTKNDEPHAYDFEMISDKRYASVKGYAVFEIISKKYPSIKLIEVEDTKSGLELVVDNKAHGYIDALHVINYEIARSNIKDLKINLELDVNFQLSMGLSKKSDVLLSVINKAIFKVPEDDKKRILYKWLTLKDEKTFDYNKLILPSFLIFIIFSILGFFLLLTYKSRQEALRANQAKSDLLANVSHEMRTPLNAIQGLCHLALKTKLDTQQKDYLTKIEKSSAILKNVINDILDISRAEAGKLQIVPSDCSLHDLIKDMYSLFAFQAQDKGIELTISQPSDLPNFIKADTFRINQVLNNLIGNAFKFTERGRISVSVSMQNKADGKKYLSFEVNDTGIGISSELQKSLFEPFTQADSSISREYGGTGLGLSISKKLVEQMGGSISVESELGKGTQVSFEVPVTISKSESQCDGGKSEGIIDFSGSHILLVEDNDINQQIVVELLEDKGAIVTCRANGHEAFDALFHGASSFDLVLMDIQMPLMDGYEATQRIRQDKRFVDLPIIAMTANAMAENIDRTRKKGMNGFIPKPIEPDAFFKTLSEFLPEKLKDTQSRLRENILEINSIGLPDLSPAFEITDAWKRVNYNADLLLRLLSKFHQLYSDVIIQLKNLIEEQKLKDAKRLAHTLSGGAANLGAYHVADCASALEKAIDEQNHPEIYEKLNELDKAIAPAINAIAGLNDK